MILANPTDAAPLHPEFHTPVPTSHVNATTGAAIRTYAVRRLPDGDHRAP